MKDSGIMKMYILLQLILLSYANQLFATGQPVSPTQPNIIFILTDDQRWDSVGFMGQKIGKTPHLDQLAQQGTVFENAFVTSAICTPSRASYMLGQFERKHGVNFNSGTAMAADAWSHSYPALLKKAGYTTAYIGKNHLPIGDKGYRTGLMENTFDYWYAGHNHISFYSKDYHQIFDNAAQDTQAEIIAEGTRAFLDPTSNTAFYKNALSFLQKRDPQKPFCLSICFNLPHGFSTGKMQQRPTDDELYRTHYRDQLETLPLPPHYVADADLSQTKLPLDILHQDLRQTGYNWVNNEHDLRERMVRILQAVTGIDRMIGNLRETLEASGFANNTVIIFSSDHGLQHGEFGLGGKALCYDTCLRVPMLIYDPRQTGGHRSDHLVQSIDVAPTILELAGIPPADSMQGKSLMPLVRRENIAWREAAFGENLWSTIFGNPRIETVRTKEFRYIRYFKNENRAKRQRTPDHMLYTVTEETAQQYAHSLTATIYGEAPVYEELYHTALDPYEAVNLVHDASHRSILNNLRSTCDQLVRFAKGSPEVPPETVRIDHAFNKTNYRKK